MDDPDITALYRSTRREEPNAALDGRILSEARHVARRRRNRWLLPLSSAAVVMLGLTLTLKLVDQEPTLPSVEDAAVDEAVEMMSVPQKSVAGKKQKAEAPLRRDMGGTTVMEHKEAEVRLRQALPAEDGARPAAAGRAVAPLSRDIDLLSEEQAPPIEKEKVFAGAMPVPDPEPWLERISKMVEAGESDKAVIELKRFRESYPDCPIPEVMLQLLGTD